MRLIFKNVVKYSKFAKCVNNKTYPNYFTTRTISGNHTTVLNEETLTGRILLYLNNDTQQTSNKQLDKTEDLLKVLDSKNVTGLKRYDINQVISVFSSLSDPSYVHNNLEFLKLLNLLDLECCKRLHRIENETVLRILQCYMRIIPNRILEYKFYHLAVDKLYNNIETLSKHDLLQLVFYIGLQKKFAKTQNHLRKCLKFVGSDNFLKELTTEELCIVCNATFKTSTKITNRLLLDKVRNVINDNLYLLKDPALFITLIKTIRHNRYQNEDLMETISCTTFFNNTIDCYNFSAICHILALYSDYLYYSETLLNMFTNKCIKELQQTIFISKQTYLTEQMRGKDIKRFIWSLSNINYQNLNINDIKRVIVPKILERIEAGEFKSDPGSLIEIIMYLWMLNYKAYELVPYTFTKDNLTLVKATKSKSKQRLNLLLSCIFFEDRELFKRLNLHPEENNTYNTEFQLQKRPILRRVLENLKPLAIKHNLSHFKINCAIPYLNIVGITGYRKEQKSVYIEVLDEFTSVKNTNSDPSGLMQLKLRILDRFEEGLIVVDSAEIDSMTEAELQFFLHDELELVC